MTLVLTVPNALDVVKSFYFPVRNKKNQSLDPPIIHYTEKHSISIFVDCFKSNVKTWIASIDSISGKPLPIKTDLRCWNHDHPFTTCALGVPIKFCKYNSSSLVKKAILDTYFKDLDSMKHSNKVKSANSFGDINMLEYFETIGVFCSFPCMQSYVYKNSHSVLFKESTTLIELMYYKYYGNRISIPEAPPRELINVYGGELTLEEWLDKLNNLDCCKINKTVNMKRPFTISQELATLSFSTSSYFSESV